MAPLAAIGASSSASDTVVPFSIRRPFGKAGFEAKEQNFLGSINPETHSTLTVDPDLLALVHRLDCGALLVSRSREVVEMNACALCLAGDGLTVRRGRILASSTTHQGALDDFLRAAFDQDVEEPGSLALPRPSGKRPLVLRAVPLSKHEFPGHTTKQPRLVLLLLFDLEQKDQTGLSALRSLGLTAAEARVAMRVGSGASVKEAANHLKVSADTIRAHLKRIYLKLDVQRQGDLVQIVTRLQLVK